MSAVAGVNDVGGHDGDEVAVKYSAKVAAVANDQAKQDGQNAVALVQSASPPPPSEGKGSHVNTYA